MNGCAPGIALIGKLRGTRKWAVLVLKKKSSAACLTQNTKDPRGCDIPFIAWLRGYHFAGTCKG